MSARWSGLAGTSVGPDDGLAHPDLWRAVSL